MANPNRSIEDILSISKDFDLCDELFCKIYHTHARGISFDMGSDFVSCNPMDAGILRRYERTVILVWDAAGIIGDGGFHYLFEADYLGDPGYVLMAASFKEIGCEAAAQAFADALAIFPGNSPPTDPKQKITMYEAVDEKIRDEIDGRFFDALNSKSIEQRLAAYIRLHRDDFLRHSPASQPST